MKVIIYKTDNNGINIVYPAPSWTGTLEELVNKDVPTGTPWRITDISEIPPDRTFRNAWRWQDDTITININIAKEIWKDKFREARKPILEKLDVEFMRALEAGDTQKQQEIASKKQDLRDITNISLPDDIEGIKKVWPGVLNS